MVLAGTSNEAVAAEDPILDFILAMVSTSSCSSKLLYQRERAAPSSRRRRILTRQEGMDEIAALIATFMT